MANILAFATAAAKCKGPVSAPTTRDTLENRAIRSNISVSPVKSITRSLNAAAMWLFISFSAGPPRSRIFEEELDRHRLANWHHFSVGQIFVCQVVPGMKA